MDNKNIVTGSVWKSLVLFALPLIGGNIFQQLYYIVDMIIVGRALGSASLAAVGATTTICNVFLNIAVGFGAGALVIISQLFGAKNFSRMKTAISTSIITLLLLSVIIMFVVAVFANSLLSLTNVSEALHDDAYSYITVYAYGFPGLFLYNICNSSFNALGKSRLTFGLLVFSSILNIFLDLWFIVGLGMGAEGAALATIISQYLAAAISFILLIRHIKKHSAGDEKIVLFDAKMLVVIAKVAIPTVIHMLVMSVGYVALQTLVNTYDTAIISGYVAAVKLDSICIVPLVQIGNALATFTGQNIGAKKLGRIPKGFHATLVMNAIFSACMVIIMLFGRDFFVGLFMDKGADPAAITAGSQYIIITCAFYVVMGAMSIVVALLRGAGDVVMSLFAIICNFVIRIAFAYSMVFILNKNGASNTELAIWWSNTIGWSVGFIVGYIRYKTGKWKSKSLVDKA